jgi:HPt (histidine-containing phosphotransfer) domain-containing protein
VANQLCAEFGLEPLRRLVTLFRAEATLLVATTAEAVDTGDSEAVERATHTLKSSAANLGAYALQASCSELETLARNRSLERAQSLTESMVDQLAAAVGVLEEIVAAAAETSEK